MRGHQLLRFKREHAIAESRCFAGNCNSRSHGLIFCQGVLSTVFKHIAVSKLLDLYFGVNGIWHGLRLDRPCHSGYAQEHALVSSYTVWAPSKMVLPRADAVGTCSKQLQYAAVKLLQSAQAQQFGHECKLQRMHWGQQTDGSLWE